MSWTAKQVSDLDNSMVAAQNVNLGTVVDALVTEGAGYKVRSGVLTPSSASVVISGFGLSTVTSAVCSLGSAPKTTHMFSTAAASGSTGNIVISNYLLASASMIVACSGSTADAYANVYWIAIGT